MILGLVLAKKCKASAHQELMGTRMFISFANTYVKQGRKPICFRSK